MSSVAVLAVLLTLTGCGAPPAVIALISASAGAAESAFRLDDDLLRLWAQSRGKTLTTAGETCPLPATPVVGTAVDGMVQ